MKKTLSIVLLLLSPTFLSASETFCEGWYQEAGKELQTARMNIETSNDKNTVFSITNNGYDFRVNWDKGLTTFYVWISQNGNRILATTARVPTENHPENFTDLHLPSGPRLSVNCEMK